MQEKEIMANTKNSQIRQKVIDRCLKSDKPHSLQDIMDECNEEFWSRGLDEVTSPNTIRADIRNIEEIYGAEIIQTKEGRFNYWSYADKNFSIFNNPLKDDEIVKLKETIELISKFSGRINFELIDDMAVRLNSIIDYTPDNRKIIGFDDNPDYEGFKWIDPIFEAISNKYAISIVYQEFSQEAKTVIVSPYFLKQYNKRWFLFCKDPKWESLSIYALDRIKKVSVSSQKYEDTDFDFDDYFYDIVGVTKPKKSEIQKIRLFVKSKTLNYIETKPIHPTQTIKEKTEEGAIVEIKSYVNTELEQLILSYSDSIKVLEPLDFQERIKSKLQSALENYQ